MKRWIEREARERLGAMGHRANTEMKRRMATGRTTLSEGEEKRRQQKTNNFKIVRFQAACISFMAVSARRDKTQVGSVMKCRSLPHQIPSAQRLLWPGKQL